MLDPVPLLLGLVFSRMFDPWTTGVLGKPWRGREGENGLVCTMYNTDNTSYAFVLGGFVAGSAGVSHVAFLTRGTVEWRLSGL